MPAPLFHWRSAVASVAGPEKATTRHVLLTLALYMDADGGSCFPATATLAEATGLSERAVCTHLEIASDAGWIRKISAGKSGKGWKRNGYLATLPKALNLTQKALNLVQYEEDEGTEPHAEGTEPHDRKALNVVQSISSGITPETTVEEEARANLDTLPPGVRRYADQIHAAFALDTDARRQFAYRALKAGLMPAPELTHQLDAAAAEHGDLAPFAALVVTDNDAESRFPKQRTAFFESVLVDIAGHRHRAALPPSADTPEDARTTEALPHPMEHLTRKQAAVLARIHGLSLDADTYDAGQTRGGIPLIKFRIERLIEVEAVTESEALAKQHRPS